MMKGKKFGKQVKASILAVALLVGSLAGASTNRMLSSASGLPEYNMMAEEQSEDLVLKKELTSYDPETEEGMLTLEAYLTAEMITQISSKPFDIILVLDQSQSMVLNKMFIKDYYVECAGASSTSDELYILLNDKYQKVNIEKTETETYTACKKTVTEIQDGSYYFWDSITNKYYRLRVGHKDWNGYYVYYEKNGNRQYLGSGLNGNTSLQVYSKEEVEVYTYSYKDSSKKTVVVDTETTKLYKKQGGGTLTRLEALKRSVEDFVGIIRADSSEHRIAIVGFGSNYTSTESTSEILTAQGTCSQYDYNGKSGSIGVAYNSKKDDYNAALNNALVPINDVMVDYAITALASTDSGTRTDIGLEMAAEILDRRGQASDRGTLVVVLTDGVPTSVKSDHTGEYNFSSGSFSHTVASLAIDYAYEIKNTYNAETFVIGFTDDTDNYIGEFLDALSSDYKDAQGTSGTKEWYKRMGNEYADKYAYSLKVFDALNNAFVKIAMEMKQISLNLDATSVLVDTMSSFFEIDKTKDINIYTSKSSDAGKTWGNLETDKNITYTLDNDRIIVTGFDYSENWVDKNGSNECHAGKKLVVQIPIKATDLASLGGNNIPTNETTSGIYNVDGTECFGNFETPKVNRIIDYAFDVQDQSIYLGTEADIGRLLEGAQEAYLPNGRNNFLVNITYSILDGEKEIAQLVIPAGTTYEPEDTAWEELEEGMLKQSLDDCHTYTIQCKVSPIEAGQKCLNQLATTTTLEKDAQIHVLYPTISCADTTILLGEEIDEKTLVSGDVSWEDRNSHEGIANPMTDAPELSIQTEVVAGTPVNEAEPYKPQEDTSFRIQSVLSDGTEILDKTKIVKKPIGHNVDCLNKKEDVDFTIHVVPGTISIVKEIEDESVPLASVQANYKNTGEPIFTFRIEKLDELDQVEKVLYRTVRFEKDDSTVKDLEPLKDLEIGKYRITELETQRYSLKDLKVGEQNECGYEKNDNSITVTIGYGEDGSIQKHGEVLFVNKRTGKKGTPTDTDVKVNRFVYKNGEWTFEEAYSDPEDAIRNSEEGDKR